MLRTFKSTLLITVALYSSVSYAHSFDMALTLTEGTTVGEDVYFSENNSEVGLSTTAYVTIAKYAIMIGAEFTTSDKRESQQYKLGMLRSFHQNHQLAIYLHSIDAEEKYFFTQPVIDGIHRQALTNAEWGLFTKLKYQYQMQHVGVGFLASTDIESTQLVQDELSAIIAYKKSNFFAQVIAGDEQQQFSIGINLSL
ncbi:hypothetical protein RGQ13_02590 [Thalassotalea psychrophila]|uniref:Outer membrane protein beta-barrel domain-containing protein n=1 Tax=Thalassotalea psychrophila TaxID=3065647 RepID=A0ABY9TVK3_9GAMM|nr:hypothetical protein RGQ13_02590 [Colwelliaceae bacterium SQ149]